MKSQCASRSALLFAGLIVAFSAEIRGEITTRVPGDFGWRKSVPLELITNPDVIKDLGLSEQVAEQLKNLHEETQVEAKAEHLKQPKDATSSRSDRWLRKYEWNDPTL